MCNMGPETEPFTHQRKVQNIGNTISYTDKQLAGPHKNSKKHIYEQHGLIVIFLGWTRLHATWIKPEVVATRKYTGYLHYRFITTGSRFLWSPCCSATTSGFIQVACNRVQPRKITIEKKDEINEYKKKRNIRKSKRQKEERTSVSRPLSWNIYAKKQCRHINRAGCYTLLE
jgi:hypothetical protein